MVKKIVLILLVLGALFYFGRGKILTKENKEQTTQKTEKEAISIKKMAVSIGVLKENPPEESSFWNRKWGIGLFVGLLTLGVFFVLAPIYVFSLNLLGLHAFIFDYTKLTSWGFLSFCFLVSYFAFNYVYPIEGEESEDGRPKKPNFHQNHAKKLKALFWLFLIFNVCYFAQAAHFEYKIIDDFKLCENLSGYPSAFFEIHRISENSCAQNKYEELLFKHVFSIDPMGSECDGDDVG